MADLRRIFYKVADLLLEKLGLFRCYVKRRSWRAPVPAADQRSLPLGFSLLSRLGRQRVIIDL